MSSVRIWCVIAVLLAVGGEARALKPGKHADLAKEACTAAGLPRDFCTRTATEDYDTDSREWDDLRAHAQIDDNETACVAADGAALRVWQLGGELRAALAAVAASGTESDVGKVGAALGRALHTIQDNCAHHGMPNPQHAWFSMSDSCDGTELSPDIQDDAIACARSESAAVMTLVAAAVRDAGVASRLGSKSCPSVPNNNHNNQQEICQRRFLPGPIDACRFLARSHDWDGIDRQWENGVVTPALRAAFAAGLAGELEPAPMCGGDETVLSPAVSDPIVDVSGGPASCASISLFCLGKADDADNPFADDPAEGSAGCNAGGGRAGILGLLLIACVLARRCLKRG